MNNPFEFISNTTKRRRPASVLLLGLALCAALGLGACGTNTTQSTKSDSTQQTAAQTGDVLEKASGPYATGTHHAKIEVANFGTIEVELNANAAPITVSNFANLAKKGFYNGLTFHRVIDGFMIQGGDPNHNGTGGSGVDIKGEFAENGVKNPISHTRGTISMARSEQKDSASSQFFICQQDCSELNGKYAAFGHVVSGMDVVDKIAKQTKVLDNNGTVNPKDQPVITSITMID